MKNHAFLILAHKQPKLLARILRILEKDNHFFFINVDKKNERISDFKESCNDINNVRFIENNVAVYHCGISHLYALCEMFTEAFASNIKFDYFHVISGQDYPIRSNEQFDEFFEKTNSSFMYIDSGEFKESMMSKYWKFANGWHLNKTSGILYRLYYKLHLSTILGLLFRRKPINNYVGGWDWFSWNVSVAEYVMKFLKDNPDFVDRFNHTLCPTEHIFPTILESQKVDLQVETNNPLRYISWQPHRPVQSSYRPFNFNEEDYPYIKDSKAFFCRKVDEIESQKLLDLIDLHRNDYYDINEHTEFI